MNANDLLRSPDRSLSMAQRQRIRAKITAINSDIAYLLEKAVSGPAHDGSVLADIDVQRRRAETLQQVLETNNLEDTRLRVEILQQTDTQESHLEAALLLWAIGD